MTRRLVFVAVLLDVLLAAAPRAAHAQDPVLRPDTIEGVADTIPREYPVPRGAFIRAMLVPGWGHLYIRSPTRGAVYFALQSASWFMLVKTIRGLNDARDIASDFEAGVRDSLDLVLEGDTMRARRFRENPELYEEVFIGRRDLVDKRNLVVSRERHRQDWIVYTVFFTFAAAVDAYVTAHLADFPGEITTSRAPDGGFAIGLQLNVGGRRR